MIEVLNLLTENKILEQRRATLPDPKRILLGDGTTDVGRDKGTVIVDVELRQEVVRFGLAVGRVSIIAPMMRVVRLLARVQLTGQIRTGSMRDAN